MFALRGSVEKVASTNCRVLITGPTGSGKELVARKIHNLSRRQKGPFVIINCALLTPETLERELFGIEERSPEKLTFPGLLEKADNGTLLLDEICDMPLATQNKVVRILQDQVVTRINSAKSFRVDVRILASTAKDISKEILEGRFREDLFYRLSVIPLQTPPLTQYRDDIPKLLDYYMARVSHKLGLPAKIISPDAIAVLQNYEWPGNLKQLINIIEWLLIMSPAKDDVEITAQMLPREIMKAASPLLSWDKSGEILKLPLKEARESFEIHYLEAQIHRFSGNISQTAQFVEMERSALHRKLKTLGIESRVKS
jgi:two-component system nitrogen regulation response regulator NtrX